MGGEEGTSNGDTELFKREELNNGCQAGFEHDCFDGNSSGGEGFRTYKRRKHSRSSSEGKQLEEWTSCSGTADKITDQNLRDVILEHPYQSFSDEEGGIHRCTREAFLFCQEIDCATTVNETQTQYPPKSHLDVISYGSLSRSDHGTNTYMCQRAFLDIINSEKFNLLTKVLHGNFNGIKADRVFDFCAIKSRMKQGAYESSPMQFVTDMQQEWKNLRDVAAAIITLAENLSELSQTSCNKHVGGSTRCILDEGKSELGTLEPPESGLKVEQAAARDVYKIHTGRSSELMVDEKYGLPCDSCEEMYHISCIGPTPKEIPPKSWNCGRCTTKEVGSPHENCVVCKRLNSNASRIQINQAVAELCSNNGETSTEFEEHSNCTTADVGKPLPSENGSDNMTSEFICKLCGGAIQDFCDKFRSCEHEYCESKFYHERCLTPKQLKHYGPLWYCPSCLCRACLTDRDDDKILICDGCERAYHMDCLKPPRTSIPKGRWFCRKCDAGLQEIRRVKKAYVHKQKQPCEVESDRGSGGMDMLLNAARTLNFQEMATIHGGCR